MKPKSTTATAKAKFKTKYDATKLKKGLLRYGEGEWLDMVVVVMLCVVVMSSLYEVWSW